MGAVFTATSTQSNNLKSWTNTLFPLLCTVLMLATDNSIREIKTRLLKIKQMCLITEGSSNP